MIDTKGSPGVRSFEGFGSTALGWTQALWALLVLGGYFFILMPHLPQGVPIALATARGEAALAALENRGGTADRDGVKKVLEQARRSARLESTDTSSVTLNDADFERRFETRAQQPDAALHVLDAETRKALLAVPWFNRSPWRMGSSWLVCPATWSLRLR